VKNWGSTLFQNKLKRELRITIMYIQATQPKIF
jgi:hypothetical protein